MKLLPININIEHAPKPILFPRFLTEEGETKWDWYMYQLPFDRKYMQGRNNSIMVIDSIWSEYLNLYRSST